MGAKYHSSRAVKKVKTRFQKEQKELYSQYYNDVYKLTEQNQELNSAVQQLQQALMQVEETHELEALQRDYDEFKQPDIDGDDRISRAEFNMYVRDYLANYPGLQEKDYPKFEDFDHDGKLFLFWYLEVEKCYLVVLLIHAHFCVSGDGFVSFKEYAQQMALQAQKAEKEQMYGGGGDSQKAQAYNAMAGKANQGNFQDMYANYR